MKIPVPNFGQTKSRAVGTQFENFNRDDGTNNLQQGIGQLVQGVDDVQTVNAARAARAKAKADGAAHDSLFAQAQEFTNKQLHGYDEAPESKPEGTTSIDTLTVEDLETAGGPGKHVAGYLDSRGNEAYEKASGVTTALQKRYNELLGLAGNDDQRAVLSKSLDRLRNSVQSQVAQHEGTQMRVAELAASKSLLDSTLRTAANLYNDDGQLKPFVDDALASLKRTALPEEYEAQKTAYLAQVSKVMISKYIAAGDLEGAEERLKTDRDVLGDEAPKVMELLATKKKAAAKDAAELTTQAMMERTAGKLRGPDGFMELDDESKLRDEALARYPEDREEATRVAEQWINREAERRATKVKSWTMQAKSIRLDAGTRGIPSELMTKLKRYNPDYVAQIRDEDRDRFEKWQKRQAGGAEAKRAEKQQKADDKLALTRFLALSYKERTELEQSRGFESLVPGKVLSEQGIAELQRSARTAITYVDKGFDRAKEALDNDIEKIATERRLKGEEPGTQFELRSDAAGELDLFLEQNGRLPTVAERAKILSDVTLKQKTKPRVLESIRGKGQEFPFQQKKREGVPTSAPTKLPPGRYESKSKPGTFFVVDAQGNKRPE